MKNILEAKDMNLWYSNFHALKNINMEIPKNQITKFARYDYCGYHYKSVCLEFN